MAESVKLPAAVNWDAQKRQIRLAFDRFENIVTIEGLDYQLKYLDSIMGSKGGNSNIFLLVDPDDEENESEHLVIKICNTPIEKSTRKYKRRFQRELLALRKAKKAKKENIIKYFHNGILIIDRMQFPFYTMEKADWDLTKYLRENEVGTDQKLLLCLSILNGFKELHELEIYHRDIKHDNIFFLNRECKVGDLGLVRFREDDVDFIQSEIGDRIGAYGWESPETMNKYLTEKYDDLNFDCEMDTQSDIFQLGKLFWYIFQGNLPIGQITPYDFKINDQQIFEIIFSMLQHSKAINRRIQSIMDVEAKLRPIAKDRALI